MADIPAIDKTAYNFTVILDTSGGTNTPYIDTLDLNGSTTTILFNGGSGSIPSRTGAIAIIQTFTAIYTTGIWKVISSVNPYSS
jgi:hypothetical protein